MKIIKASAGSGKTYRLAYEYIRTVVDEPSRYRSTLAVTFTNKATEEMKSRVVGELAALSKSDDHAYMADLCRSLHLSPEKVKKRASEALAKILHNYSHFGIMTIDRFFQKIVRGFVRELDLESGYNIDLNTDYLLALAVDSFIDSGRHDRRRQQWIVDYIDRKIDQGKGRDFKNDLADFAKVILKPEFESYPEGERMEIMAEYIGGIVERGRQIPERLKRLASDALAAIGAEGLGESDFYQGKNGLYGYLVKVSRGRFDAPGMNVCKAMTGDDSYWKKGRPMRYYLIDVLRQTDVLVRELSACDTILRFCHEYLILGDISAELDAVLRDNNTMIISRTNSMLSRLTHDNDAPFIYERSGVMFDTFLIDEFQDTSAEQWGNFAPLVNNAIGMTEEGRESVVIVGDTKQSIYRWRGGDWRLIDGGLKEYLDSNVDVKEEVLGTNYRSRRNIIRFNNAVMRSLVRSCNDMLNGRVGGAFDAGLITREQRAELYDLLDKAYRDMEQNYSPKNSDNKGSVRLYRIDRGRNDAKDDVRRRSLDVMVADMERLQDDGYRASDMAILVRETKEARMIASYLLDYKRTHPSKRYCYEVVSAEALSVGSSPVVRFILAAFGLAVDEGDSVNQALFNRFLGREIAGRLGDDDRKVVTSLRSLSLEESFELLCRTYALDRYDNAIAYLQAFHDIVLSFSEQIQDLPAFMEMWERHGDRKYIALPDGQDSVTIQTIHKAKGLQYKVIFIPFASWELGVKTGSKIGVKSPPGEYAPIEGLIVSADKKLAAGPFAYSYLREDVMSVIEDINILYVALTRAVDHLIVGVLPEAKEGGNVGDLIAGTLSVEGDKVFIRNDLKSEYENEIEGCVADDGSVWFGCKTLREGDKEGAADSQLWFDSYPSVDYTGRLGIYLTNGRYFDGGGATPRSYGVRMHRLFERAATVKDVYESLEGLARAGELDAEAYAVLKVQIDNAFSNVYLRKMFSDKAAVYCERNILLPAARSVHEERRGGSVSSPSHLFARPDRVVAMPDKTYLLDYKFGAPRKEHERQMRVYAELLSSMGYPDIRAFLWYVSSGELVEV